MDFEEFAKWERASRDTIDFKVAYVDMAGGDLTAGLLLSQVVFWHLPDKSGKSKLKVQREGKRWLAKAHADWWDEVRVPERTVKRKLKLLEGSGLIETRTYRFNGLRTTHIRIIPEAFLEAWKKALDQYGQSEEAPTVRPNWPDRKCQNGPTEEDRLARPITETTTETTTETAAAAIEAHDDTTKEAHSENGYDGRKERLAALGIDDPALSKLAARPEITEAVTTAWGRYLLEHPDKGPGFCISFLMRGGNAIWPPKGRGRFAMPGDAARRPQDYRIPGKVDHYTERLKKRRAAQGVA